MEIILINIDYLDKIPNIYTLKFQNMIKKFQDQNNIIIGYSNENRLGLTGKIKGLSFSFDYIVIAYGSLVLNNRLEVIDQEFHNFELLKKMYEDNKVFSIKLIDDLLGVNGWDKTHLKSVKGDITELEPLTIILDTGDLEPYSEFDDDFSVISEGGLKVMIPKDSSFVKAVQKILEQNYDFKHLNAIILCEDDLKIYDLFDFTVELSTYTFDTVEKNITEKCDFVCDSFEDMFDLINI